MIKVYVFITGLALFQLAPAPGDTSYAILASGGYEYPGLHHDVGAHEVTVQAGASVAPVDLTMPLEAKLEVSCPEGGCASLPVPGAIPHLGTLLSVDGITPTVASGCVTFGGGTACDPRGLGVSARNGLLAFAGDWSAEALTDCGGNVYPTKLGPLVETNFVRAGRAWKLRYTDTDDLLEASNTVLFSTVVDDLADLRISEGSHQELGDLLGSSRLPLSQCQNLPGFSASGATECAVVLIRNGSDEEYLGGGDLHFGALYALLDEEIDGPDLWLPIVSTENVCGGGGGTGGLSRCIGGIVE